MGKYDFEEFYNDKTIIDADFLKNEMDYTYDDVNDEIAFKQNYRLLCNEICKLDVFKPTMTDIESLIENGYVSKFQSYKSKVETKEERQYLFLMAQGLQLIYDKINGRSNSIRGENETNNLCNDCKNILLSLGFLKNIRW